MQQYLKETNIVNYSDSIIIQLAKDLAKDCKNDAEVAKNCFVFVRDEIHHSGDYKNTITTYKASEVLEHKTGWCYAKAILLAALLRANGIPTAFCYQRLSCSEYEEGMYCLHGLNAIYLKEYGWYRVDARGNKEGVDAQFMPPKEKLAFELQENEYDLPHLYSEPLDVVIKALQAYNGYDAMVQHFPDIQEYNSSFCAVSYLAQQDAILCRWKQYCSGKEYREPLEYALELIATTHATLWITDTTNGFENDPKDTQWLMESFIPQTIQSSIKKVVFIINDDSPLKKEIEIQAEALKEFFEVMLVERLSDAT